MNGYREFNSAADLKAHYAALKKRTFPHIMKSKPVDALTVMQQPKNKRHELPLMCSKIMDAVLEVSNVSESDFVSERRLWSISFARQIFYYLVRKHTGRSYPAIGRDAGGRNHVAALRGIRKIENLLKHNCGITNKTLHDVESVLSASLNEMNEVAA